MKLNAPAPAPAPAATPPVPKGDEVPFEGVSGKDVFTAYWLEIAPEPAAAKQKEIKIEQVQVEPEEPGESYGEEGYGIRANKYATHLVPCTDTRRAKTRRCLSFRSGWSGVRNRWCVTRGAASHVGCPTRRPPYRRALHAGRPEVRVALRDEFAHVPVFELQVMPPLPYLLECAPDALDYATAAVFVCSKSCGGAGNFVEFVAAQAF